MNKEQTISQTDYVGKLEEGMGELISLLVDPGLWNFLSDSERVRVSKVIQLQSSCKVV